MNATLNPFSTEIIRDTISGQLEGWLRNKALKIHYINYYKILTYTSAIFASANKIG